MKLLGDKVDVLLQVFLFDAVDEAECGDRLIHLAFFHVMRVLADHGTARMVEAVHHIPVQSSRFTQVIDADGKILGFFSVYYSLS